MLKSVTLKMLSKIGKKVKDKYNIRKVQELLGHKDVKTTMIYPHVISKGRMGIRSPADII